MSAAKRALAPKRAAPPPVIPPVPPRRPEPPRRPGADPCRAGLDLLRSQVLFLEGSRCDPALRVMAPAFAIDPEFWGAGAAEYALRLGLQADGGAQP